MSELIYPFMLLPGAPENINQLNANLEAIRTVINGNLDNSNIATATIQSSTILTAKQVRDVGEFGQIRAGRVLTIADFTNLGLSPPLGLWNLSDTLDYSGNGRTLTNKGSVGFGPDILGSGAGAAQFTGSTAQALYIADNGTAADPFRMGNQFTGTIGAWFKTAKRGTDQHILSKALTGGAGSGIYFFLSVTTANVVGTSWRGNVAGTGATDVADNRWHHAVITSDGTRGRLYVDGALEGSSALSMVASTAASPLNIGGYGADSVTAASAPFFGAIDEAFITSDVLSDDQVRNLYLTSIPHTLGATPKTVRMRVTRRRRGGPYVALDFPATPNRLHNFPAGALANEGADANGAAGTTATLQANTGTGVIASVAGPDGVLGSAYSLSGAHTGLSGTDTGLPSGTVAHSWGAWFKTTTANNGAVMGWGSGVGFSNHGLYVTTSGDIRARSAASDDTAASAAVNDGLWHFAVVVENPTSSDLVLRKLYVDGRLYSSATTQTTFALGGANKFRIGAWGDGAGPWTGQISRAFVYAGAMTDVQVRALYNKGSQALAPSPKYEGDHIEALEATRMLATFDSIEATDLIDMEVLT